MTTESRKRKEVTPPLIPALPRDSGGLPSPRDRSGSFSFSSGDNGKQSSFCHFSGNLLAEAQRGPSFSNLRPQTIGNFGIPFILEVDLHRNSLAAGWGLYFFFLLHFTELQPFFFNAEKDRARQAHREQEHPSSPPIPPWSSLFPLLPSQTGL